MDHEMLSMNGHLGADREVLDALGRERKALPGIKSFLLWFVIAYAVTFQQTDSHFFASCAAITLTGLWGISIEIRKAHIERRYQAEMAAGMFRVLMVGQQRLHDKIDLLQSQQTRNADIY